MPPGGGPADLPSYDVLGVDVAAVTSEELTELVFQAGERPRIFAHMNLHGLYLLGRSAPMHSLLKDAYLVHVDGMPVVWIGRLLGHPFARSHRVTYVDWLPHLLRRADQERARVFFLGGKPGTGERVAHLIESQYPAIRFAHHHGYLTEGADHLRVLEVIRAFRPDVLFVGMDMPRQEDWIARNLARLPTCAVLPCGACFDYFAGLIPTPPRFLGRVGLEWLFRLATEPRRLWRRYILEPVMLLPRVIEAIRVSRGGEEAVGGRTPDHRIE